MSNQKHYQYPESRTINWWVAVTSMCKAKPSTNNGEEISSSNTAIGLVNFSAEECIVSIMIFIILILFGLYKLRQRCLKKRNYNSHTSEQTNNTHYNMNHLPNQPPAPAHDYPHNPTYKSAQLKPNSPHQPMPYNLLATLSKKNTTDSE